MVSAVVGTDLVPLEVVIIHARSVRVADTPAQAADQARTGPVAWPVRTGPNNYSVGHVRNRRVRGPEIGSGRGGRRTPAAGVPGLRLGGRVRGRRGWAAAGQAGGQARQLGEGA